MAGPWAGTDGALYLADALVAKVDEWSMSNNKEEIETTSLGDDNRTFIAGLADASLSVNGKATDDASFLTLVNQFMEVDNDSGGSSVSTVASATLGWKLYLNKAASGGSSVFVSCSSVSSGLELSQSDLGKWSFNGRVTGTPRLNIEGEA
jgi:hypothetical protein